MSKCTCVRPEAILNGVCANCEFPVTPKPEAPAHEDLTDDEHEYQMVVEREQSALKPAKDAGAREWPTEMLKNLDASLKLQSMLAAPDHAWIGPSVIEVATAAYEKLERELAEAKETIRTYEHECETVREMKEQLTQERTKSAALVELSELQDKLLLCYRTGRQPGKWLDKMAELREALAKWGKG